MQILHIADVHFDTSFGCKSSRVRDALRSATRTAFLRAVDDAIACDVDAVVIAGDLFDDQRLRLDTERFLFGALAKLEAAEIPVVYATGNHDPSAPGSRLLQLKWPGTVTLLRGPKPAVVTVNTAGGPLHLVGAGHETERELRNLAASFPTLDESGVVVGILHTNVENASTTRDHHAYAPCVPDDLNREGYSYWALGHVHVPGPVPSKVPAYYAGCLQGRHFQEAGPRGGYLVTIEENVPAEIRFRSYAPIQWHSLDISLDAGGLDEAPTDVRALDGLVAAGVDQLRRDYPDVDLAVRVSLTGGSALHDELSDPEQCVYLADAWTSEFDLLYVEVDPRGVHAALDLDSVRSETTVLAEALGILDEVLVARDAGVLADLVSAKPLARDVESLLSQLEKHANAVRYELADRLLVRD